MCVVSMVGDHYREKWGRQYDWIPAQVWPSISREEFDALKRDVEELAGLLKRAKAYDEQNGEPACEQDEKVAVLRRVAKLIGVELPI